MKTFENIIKVAIQLLPTQNLLTALSKGSFGHCSHKCAVRLQRRSQSFDKSPLRAALSAMANKRAFAQFRYAPNSHHYWQ
jgi:hypothetical protein